MENTELNLEIKKLSSKLQKMQNENLQIKNRLKSSMKRKVSYCDYQRLCWQISGTDLHFTDFKKMFGDKMKSMFTIKKENIDSITIAMFKLHYVKPNDAPAKKEHVIYETDTDH